MADFNQAVPVETLVVRKRITLDPETILTPPVTVQIQPVTTLTVANGGTLLVYDVTNPASPVLVATIG